MSDTGGFDGGVQGPRPTGWEPPATDALPPYPPVGGPPEPPAAWPGPGAATADQDRGSDPASAPASSPAPVARASGLEEVVAGVLAGLGILLTIGGLVASVKVWNGLSDAYGGDSSLGQMSGRSGLSGMFDAQRWAAVSAPLQVAGVGLVVVCLALLLRRVSRLSSR